MSQDRTEAPTAKRRRKAREKGQVARSAELVGSGILLGLISLLPRLMPSLRDEAGGYWVSEAGERPLAIRRLTC